MTPDKNANSKSGVEDEFETFSMQARSLLRGADKMLFTIVQRLDDDFAEDFFPLMAVLDVAAEKFKAAETAYLRDCDEMQSEIRSLKAELAAKVPA
ncbi:hypothetical protein G6K88_07610 [Agrobacterium rhizogenes]|uniref:hypothetical protein n=1 Tax=Rhizobium rhizogenes TaxID=359 RepID=UPI0015733445|nr:hypothetical protein [Rhizobium rhizogenes]NTI01885.1 hypothetical protein [Rhizobium rhizogenes]NTI08688.1 hypothetical protein [Rhizobium rhizogenes]